VAVVVNVAQVAAVVVTLARKAAAVSAAEKA
jgi:hypothetical protein